MTSSQRSRLFAHIRRRDLVIKLLGALLMGVSGMLAWQLMHDPLGTVPGSPSIWKGTPMILSAAFTGIYGALLLLLRRFSLAAVLLAMLLAGASAMGAQAYARTISDREEVEFNYALPKEQIEGFLETMRVALPESLLLALTQDLQAAGHIEEPPAFDEVAVAFGAPGAGGGVQISLRFTYCPFVHARQSPGRYAASLYAQWIADRHVAGLLSTAGGAPEKQADPAKSLDTLVRYLYRRSSRNLAHPVEAARWLYGREPDPELKKALHAYMESHTR